MRPRAGSSPIGPADGLAASKPGAPWTPLKIGDALEFWLRGDAVHVTQDEDGFVSDADDQSGNGRDVTQATEILQPQFQFIDEAAGIGVFAFGGAEYLEQATALGMPADNWTVAGVYQTDSTSTNQCYMTVGAATAGYALINDAGSKQAVRSGGVGVVPDGASDTSLHLVVVTRTAGILRMYVDGEEVSLTGGNATVNLPSGTTLVGALTAALWFLVGTIAELICVSRVMTAAELAKLWAYAQTRYGL